MRKSLMMLLFGLGIFGSCLAFEARSADLYLIEGSVTFRVTEGQTMTLVGNGCQLNGKGTKTHPTSGLVEQVSAVAITLHDDTAVHIAVTYEDGFRPILVQCFRGKLRAASPYPRQSRS